MIGELGGVAQLNWLQMPIALLAAASVERFGCVTGTRNRGT